MEVSITRIPYLINLIFSLMSEWFDSQKKQTSNFHKTLQEQIEKLIHLAN